MAIICPFPWLTQAGTFQYRDVDGHPFIQDFFEDAKPFYGEYAVVARKNKYGVINRQGHMILPLKYDTLEHYYNGKIHVFAVKKQYDAWWRFWSWRLLPEFNILSTSHRGPILVTRVPRAVWRLIAMPGRSTLARLRIRDYDTFDPYWKDYWNPDRAFPKQLHFSIQDREVHFQETVVDLKGRKVRRKKKYEGYTKDNQVIFQSPSGERLIVPARSEHGMTIIPSPVWKDLAGNTYLAPHLEHPLPAQLPPHPIIGEIGHIHFLARHPTSEWFVILASRQGSYRRLCLLINSQGEWMEELPPLNGLHWITEHGEMILDYQKKPQIVDAQFQLHDVPITHINWISSNPNLYSGKCLETNQYGIYHLQERKWQVPPLYSYMHQEIAEGIVIYAKIVETHEEQIMKRELKGLLDVYNNREITPPLYERIGVDGHVRRREKDAYIHCFIDPHTGKEYRD